MTERTVPVGEHLPIKRVDVPRLYATDDAAVWAEEFMQVIDGGVTPDFGLMVGWFANAIEVAKRIAGEHSDDRSSAATAGVVHSSADAAGIQVPGGNGVPGSIPGSPGGNRPQVPGGNPAASAASPVRASDDREGAS